MFANCIRIKLCDMQVVVDHCCIELCLLTLFAISSFSSDDAYVDRYDYLGYGSDFEEFDEEC